MKSAALELCVTLDLEKLQAESFTAGWNMTTPIGFL